MIVYVFFPKIMHYQIALIVVFKGLKIWYKLEECPASAGTLWMEVGFYTSFSSTFVLMVALLRVRWAASAELGAHLLLFWVIIPYLFWQISCSFLRLLYTLSPPKLIEISGKKSSPLKVLPASFATWSQICLNKPQYPPTLLTGKREAKLLCDPADCLNPFFILCATTVFSAQVD